MRRQMERRSRGRLLLLMLLLQQMLLLLLLVVVGVTKVESVESGCVGKAVDGPLDRRRPNRLRLVLNHRNFVSASTVGIVLFEEEKQGF